MKWPWSRGTKQEWGEHGRYGDYYVYYLRYPPAPEVFGRLAGTVFYIGKGTRDRLLAHEKETRLILQRGRMMLLKHKHKVIIQIWDAGYDVFQEIAMRFEYEEDAYQFEAAAIKQVGLEHLTNATYGHKPRITKKAPHLLR